jgi:glycosyltransferase involved in cell wall biosynthesis
MKKIFIVSGCKNEEGNVLELYERINKIFSERLSNYNFELLFVDNASSDATVTQIKGLCAIDSRVKLIVNMRDFGTNKSGYHGLMHADGDAVVGLASDLEDPPELIPEFIKHWENGFPIVLGRKSSSNEPNLIYLIRTAYYKILNRLSEVPILENVTGFGLYDIRVINEVRKINDPNSYFRGLICELGFDIKLVDFSRKTRTRGVTKNNFFSLWDTAMLGVTKQSRVPLRLATFIGVITGLFSLLTGIVYFFYKLFFWDEFAVGVAPIVMGMFFLAGVQLVFIGVLGEYIGAIYSLVEKKPIVIERERVNL